MHAGGARHLRQPADRILHFIRCRHHQVGKFINDNDDLRHVFHRLTLVVLVAALSCKSIVGGQVPHIPRGKNLVPLEHLVDRPAQCTGSLARVCHDGYQQVRNSVVNPEFHHLRVNHQKSDVLRGRFIKQADNHRVDTHRLAGTSGARDQQMRHLCQVCDGHAARKVAAKSDGQMTFRSSETVAFDQLAHPDNCIFLVWDLNADRRLARDRRFNADSGCGEIHGKVIGKIRDFTDFHSAGGLKLVTGHRRAAAVTDKGGLYAKTFQGID